MSVTFLANQLANNLRDAMHSDGRPVVSRSYCVAKSHGLGTCRLLLHSDVSKTETCGLVSQLRRAAVSVPSNIAEGHARQSTGEFRQFLGHASGSLMEIETQILIAERLGYVDSTKSIPLLERTAEIGKILNGLLRALPSSR